jgi:hypothetical protein
MLPVSAVAVGDTTVLAAEGLAVPEEGLELFAGFDIKEGFAFPPLCVVLAKPRLVSF